MLATVVAVAASIDPDHIWEKAFDSLLALAAALVITGCVSVAVDTANRQRESRERGWDARLTLAGRVRSVHADVKRAALLIDAHQTARTYGEQMRRLIDARVEIGNVKFLARHLAGVDPPTREFLVRQLTSVTAYLQSLTEEYRDQYLRISAIQRATSAWETAQAQELAKQDDPPTPEDIVSSTVAWQELTNQAAFPRLAILLNSLETGDLAAPHQEQLSRPIETTIEALLAGKVPALARTTDA